MSDLWLALAAPLSGFFATLVWQSTLWFAAGLCASRLSKRSAARGHCLLLAMTVAAILSPALTAAVARLQWGLLPAATPQVTDRISDATSIEPVNEPRELAARDRPANVIPQPIEHGSIEHGFAPTERDAPARQPPMNPDEPTHATSAVTSAATSIRIDLKTVLAAAWFCASLVLALRLLLSLRTASRLAHRAQVETHSRLLGALAGAQAALMIRREFALRTSPAVRSPLIWCWGRRPIVLIAPDAAEQLEVNGAGVNWTSVFCHELAHWVRRDHWSALWSELLVIALPWHPLVWLSRDRLSILAEQACDDWALACGGRPVEYADSLVKLVPQPRTRTALAAVSGGRTLKLRLERVLSGRIVTPKIGGPWLTAIILVAIASAGGTAFTQHGKATPEAKPASSRESGILPSKEANGDVLTIRGRVVTPDGRPAAGAKIAILSFYVVGRELQPPIATANARSDGRFEISYSLPETTPAFSRAATLFAQSPGFGAQWTRWPDIDPTKPLVLTLARDLPIRGRVVDLQGSPVAGVRVGVMGIEKTAEGNLDATLASMQSDPSGFSIKRSIPNMLGKNVAGSIPDTTTAADGRFSLSGLGAERLVRLEFQGPTIAYTRVQVATRSNVPHLPPPPPPTNQVFAAEFILTAPPTRPIVGTIRDAATGKPLPGVTVKSNQFLGSPYLNDALRAETDANGHYELRGMPEGKGNLIQICPRDDQPYLVREVPIVPERAP
jgi:beta-lactamase regulating signal transducer with metallopeptidase domain